MDLQSRQAKIVASFGGLPEDVGADALEALDVANVPAHVAVIMDGNGRWAKARGKSRSAGHKAGVGAVRELIVAANDLGVRYLTIYSFSTENWTRPKDEVSGLMTLFAEVLAREIRGLHKEGVRVKILGDMAPLPERTRKTFQEGVDLTADNNGMTLAIAVNYGSRQEILGGIKRIAAEVETGMISLDEVTEERFSNTLYTAGMPDPDLLIRTSGEMRVSNFLLWQIAYTELWVTEKYWPDFNRYDLLQAILDYQLRERRFGGSE